MDFGGVFDFTAPGVSNSYTSSSSGITRQQQKTRLQERNVKQSQTGGEKVTSTEDLPEGDRPSDIKVAKRATGQMKKRKRTLPTKVIAIKNADKNWHEKWEPWRDLLNIPHPFRAVLMGPPNSGKTTVVKNILMRADPPFTRMVIIYPDGGGYTDEYKDCGDDDTLEMLDYIPPPSEWDGQKKTLCVVDDFELKGLSKEQRSNLDRLVGHVSTHRNVSVCICNQDPYNAPPIVRRCANLYILWKQRDMVSLQSFAKRLGADLDGLFEDHAHNRFDSIWIDLSCDSPAPLRKNGYETIDWNDYKFSARNKRKKLKLPEPTPQPEPESESNSEINSD